MARRLLAAIVVGALTAAPAVAHAQASLSISGGVSAPTGDLGDIADLGYHLSAGLDLGGTTGPLGFRLEGGYSSLWLTNGNGEVRIMSGTANVILNISKTPDSPYLIAGVGAYNRNYSLVTVGYGYGDGATVLGINAGAGLRFPLKGISTFAEARYHMMLGNHADGTNYQFIPITFGVLF
jgi:hypothetical protein